jgi:threonine/homoserine/homoserine lactone efflux protein
VKAGVPPPTGLDGCLTGMIAAFVLCVLGGAAFLAWLGYLAVMHFTHGG